MTRRKSTSNTTTPAPETRQTRLAGVDTGTTAVRAKRTPSSLPRAATKQTNLFAFFTPSPIPRNAPIKSETSREQKSEDGGHRSKRMRMTPEPQDRRRQDQQEVFEVAESQFAAVPLREPLTPPGIEELPRPAPAPSLPVEIDDDTSDEELEDNGGFKPHFMGQKRIRTLQVTPKKPKRPLIVPSSYTPKMAGGARVGSPVLEQPASPTRRGGEQKSWLEEEPVMVPSKPSSPLGEIRAIAREKSSPSPQSVTGGMDVDPPKAAQAPTSPPEKDPPQRPPLYPRDRVIPSSQWYENYDSDASLSTQATPLDQIPTAQLELIRQKSSTSTVSNQSDATEPPPPPAPRRFSSNVTIPNSLGSSSSAFGLASEEIMGLKNQNPSVEGGEAKDANREEMNQREVCQEPDTPGKAPIAIKYHAELSEPVTLSAEHLEPPEGGGQEDSQIRVAAFHEADDLAMERSPSPDDIDPPFGFHPVRTQRYPMDGLEPSQSQTQSPEALLGYQSLGSETQSYVKTEPLSQYQPIPQLSQSVSIKAESEEQSQPLNTGLRGNVQLRSSVDIMPPPPCPAQQGRLPSPSPSASSPPPALNLIFDNIPDTADTEGPSARFPDPLLSDPPGPSAQSQEQSLPRRESPVNGSDSFPISPPRAIPTVSQLLPSDLMETFPAPPDWTQSSEMEGSQDYDDDETQ